MPRQELWDPVNPQFDRRQQVLFGGARQYKVGEVGPIRKERGYFRASIRMHTDDGIGIYRRPLVIKAVSSERVQQAIQKVRVVADEEAQAYQFFAKGDFAHGDFHREIGQREREKLIQDFSVQVPRREWDYHKNVGLTYGGERGRMF